MVVVVVVMMMVVMMMMVILGELNGGGLLRACLVVELEQRQGIRNGLEKVPIACYRSRIGNRRGACIAGADGNQSCRRSK